MDKLYKTTELYTDAEQILLVQPTPQFDGIEMYIKELDGKNSSGAFYITPEELPHIIDALTEMMNYVKK